MIGSQDYALLHPHVGKARTVDGHVDSDWAVARSRTGYGIKFGGSLVGHRSRKQHNVAMSSCEAELNALADTGFAAQ